MSARDDYPIITLHESVDTALIDSVVLSNAYDEIDRLRLDVAWLESIADGRCEENRRLREGIVVGPLGPHHPECSCWIDDDPGAGFIDMRGCPIHDEYEA
jgi:hypothetical protein